MRKGKIPEDYTFCEEWSFYRVLSCNGLRVLCAKRGHGGGALLTLSQCDGLH